MDYASAAASLVLWVAVTPQTMLDPVPPAQYLGTPGAVQPAEWRNSKPIKTCPIVEDGKVVGFSLCKGD